MTDANPFPSSRRPQRKKRRLVVAGAALVAVGAVIAGSVVAASGSDSGSASYRTATVGRHPVQQTIDAVAVVQPVRQATVAFPVSGTVKSVDVSVGDTVTTGQVLAALDASALQASLSDKQAALAQAQLALQEALDGQNPGLSGSGRSGSGGSGAVTTSATGAAVPFDSAAYTAGPGGGTSGGTSPNGGSGSGSPTSSTSSAPSSADISDAQQAVLAAQQQVDQDLAAAQAAITNSSNVCAAVSSSSSPSTSDITACQQALQSVIDAQATVSKDQGALQKAVDHLSSLLEQAAKGSSSGSSTPSSTPSTGGATGTDRSQGSGASGSGATGSNGSATKGSGGSGGSTAPSASDLVAYQKAVDAASDQVAVAQQAVAQATVVSPIAGTVEAVNVTVGSSVSAASTSTNIVIKGEGGYEVTTTVAVTDLPNLEVGQDASVTPDGHATALHGQVVAIGVAGTTNASTGDTVYPVVIGLQDDSDGLTNGATANTSIVTAASRNGLAVPTSAVETLVGRHFVTVVSGGKGTRKAVTVGAMDSTWTEIKSGLRAGDRVALADLSEPLPDSATSSSNGTNGRNGGIVTGGPPVFQFNRARSGGGG
ncbi:MAG TPA: biotin/lipoyl-binding protein [Acidimicrobiales bacterium]|jgi:HlyD family secretion protein|nr:biotin/lipoyl-binding protein [Acidimicrobiales bacterium]